MIKQKWLFALSMLALVAGALLGLRQADFLLGAEKATGKVSSISKRNDECGRRRDRYDCTRFTAKVRFASQSGQTGNISVAAGTARGHNAPVSKAQRREGDPVRVIFDPGYLARAYENTTWDVWGAPLFALIVHVAMLIGSMTEQRERRSGLFRRRTF